MAYRNLTLGFYNIREENDKTKDTIIPIQQTPKRQRLLDVDLDEDVDEAPEWVSVLTEIDYDIENIEKLMKKFQDLDKKRSRVIFENNNYKEDLQIKDISKAINQKFKEANLNVKRLATVGNKNNLKQQLPLQERQIRLNAMRSRGLKIQELSKQYRKIQKNYLMKLTKNEPENSNIPNFKDIDTVGLTLQQQQQLKKMEDDTNIRTQSIIDIAKSVQELLRLFNELSVLIVEQGSLLDRIDYNVEKTVDTLQQTDDVIRQIPKYQKRSATALCILILILLVIFFAVLLIVLKTV